VKNLVTPLGYDRLFDSFELSLKADGLRPHTISCYIRDVRRFWGYAQFQLHKHKLCVVMCGYLNRTTPCLSAGSDSLLARIISR